MGLSQETVAEKAGVSVRRYQEIETGTITLNPRLETLIKYCKVLNMTLEDLLKEPLPDEIENSRKVDARRVPKK
jgi:transcriptional regulator with XRE-family HTH domain